MASETSSGLTPTEGQPYKLPGNWQWIHLENVADVIMGQSPEGTATTDDPSFMPLIGGAADMGLLFPSVKRYTKQPTKVSKNDDVILCIRATLGQPVFSDGEYCLGRGVAAVRPMMGSKEYFRYAFICFESYLYDNATGSTFAQVTSSTLRRMPIPFPPITEQRRIVDRIESLFAKLDEAKEKAQAVVDGYENRKAAILHKAFTGELTEEWRKNRGISFEQWEMVAWGDFISDIEAGKNWNALGRPPQNDEFGVVKVSAVTWGDFNEEESKTCEVQSQWNKDVQIVAGDFLFSRANTLQLVGNCVIVKQISKKLMLSDKILRIRHNETVYEPYVLYYTRTDLYRNQIESLASGNQDGMRNVSQKNMRLVKFPRAPIEEQKEIAHKVSTLIDRETKVKEAALQVCSRIETMKKAILARAFRGELGTNDPTEAPADIGTQV